jgi:starch synthase
LLPVIDRLLADDVRLIVLGEGDLEFERELTIASRRHGDRFAYRKDMDTRLSHMIEAGSDITLIPSHYEPCGLTAMYGLRYGTLPIARATGGLHEIIQDYDQTTDRGTGFLFFDPTSEAFWDAILRAKRLYQDEAQWHSIMRRAMHQDFSWPRAVERYEGIYEQALHRR